MSLRLLLAMSLLVSGSCAARTTPAASSPRHAAEAPHENLNAVLWVQTALEFEASAIQAYRLAQLQLDAALADPSWTAALEQKGNAAALKPAVIVDVDETVLDNSYYQARLIRDGKVFEPATWDRWVLDAGATAVPGAAAFARYAEKRGVTIFYVTNRTANLEEATRQNLAATGFPLSAATDTVLVRGERPEWQASAKGARREYIARDYRILLLIGDDLGDFIVDASGTPEQRYARTEPQAGWWGQRWIMVPNPTYGSWERALLGTEPDQIGARRRALKFEARR